MKTKNRKVTRAELEKEGWIYSLTFGYSLYVFKKNKETLFWDSKKEIVIYYFPENQ